MAEVGEHLREAMLVKDENLLLRLLEHVKVASALDEEFVAEFGAGGGHGVLLELVAGDERLREAVGDAACEAVEACIRHLPAGSTFPARARLIGGQGGPPAVLTVFVFTLSAGRHAQRHVRLRREREKAEDGRIGNMLFTSSVLLARWLLQNEKIVAGKSVLELGSGLGLAGIAAARLAADCTLTDLWRFVPNLQYNLRLNREFIGAVAGDTTPQVDRVRAVALDWTAAVPEDSPENGGGEEKAPAATTFPTPDVIIGADIVHERWMAGAVCCMLDRFLGPLGSAYIINPAAKSRAGVEEFRRLLPEHGFHFSVERVTDVSLLEGYEEECEDVQQELYRIARAPPAGGIDGNPS
mmetsp:Transcript_15065/g.42274  ORF Transcript_15065/g.42274 Transcript_15065/m.42274 type:complete len:354 (-) Transcript_15065:288-1349(-)